MRYPTFTLTLPSELRMLSIARTFVEAVCQTWQMDRKLLHALVLVTGEAVTNIVRHAHRARPEARMEIHFEIQLDRIELTFLDEGDPFNIDAVPQLNPNELRIGGRGVYLMRTLMDEVTCLPRNLGQSGNRLRMVKRCDPNTLLRDCG